MGSLTCLLTPAPRLPFYLPVTFDDGRLPREQTCRLLVAVSGWIVAECGRSGMGIPIERAIHARDLLAYGRVRLEIASALSTPMLDELCRLWIADARFWASILNDDSRVQIIEREIGIIRRILAG